MRLVSPWSPHLADIDSTPSERLVMALADDIMEGRLETGARLPPHRDLAYRLGIGLGSVTKAYAVLERRGLVRSLHGRGTFVAALRTPGGPFIDLSVNTPPDMLSERSLAKALVAISRKIDTRLFTHYPAAGGHDEHRRQMARWLSGGGMVADPDHLLLCNGAQHALSVAFSLACGRDGDILTEAVTYPGAIALARHAGLALTALAMDGEGIRPDALEAVLKRRHGDKVPRVLYVTPTLQNPTTATMGLRRRQDIVGLCRRHDIQIVEDDVYALCTDAGLPPLALLAPERTFYVSSLSKTLSPGLRIGVLVVPPSRLEEARNTLRTTSLMVSPLSCAVMEQWLNDGTAVSVRTSIQREARRRTSLAHELLGPLTTCIGQHGFHVWLPMPLDQAQALASAAGALGIAVTPPEAVMVDDRTGDSGIRLCLGGPALPDLTQALSHIGDILKQQLRPRLSAPI